MVEPRTKKPRIVEVLLEFSLPLAAGVVTALAWANLSPATYERYVGGLDPSGPLAWLTHGQPVFSWLVNDVFMCLFFGLAAKEITESVLPGGALNPPSRAINPLLGTLGGVLGPIAAYSVWITLTDDVAILGNGWGVPTATDIALAWLVARMCFGRGHPAVSFLLLLAIADDAIGLGIIAIKYPQQTPAPEWLALIPTAMLIAYVLRKRSVQSYWPYLVLGGAVSWCGLYQSHLHPALALVPIVPFIPAGKRDIGLFEEDETNDGKRHAPIERFGHDFKLIVDIGLFAFGIANAGVAISAIGNATWAVLLGLALGKTAGVFLFSSIAHVAGFPMPRGMDFRSLFVAGMVAGLGLTVAVFVAGAAFPPGEVQSAAKMGALLSIGIAPLAWIASRVLRVQTTK